jgi:hypothetical protein
MKPKIHHKFWHVAINNIDIPYGISLADPTIIMVHDLACFCVACFKEE